jgi:UV DNA damage endonuclease
MYIDSEGKNLLHPKILQLGRYQRGEYSEARVRQTYIDNLTNLEAGLDLVIRDGIRHFRMSSDLLPLADKVPREWWHNQEVIAALARLGSKIKRHEMRVTFHPGQFCVLNSASAPVIQNAIRDLDIHAWLFDMCGFDESPYYAINIHAGARDRFEQLVNSVEMLRPGIRQRLTFENCETVASVAELYDISYRTGVPIVFDSHHHTFRPMGLSQQEASDLARDTWPNHIRPLQHVSSTTPGLENGSFSDRRKHSDFIQQFPQHQLDLVRSNEIDVEVEAKMKNHAVLQCSARFAIPLV